MIGSVDGNQDQYYGESGVDILSYSNEQRDLNFGTFYATNGNGNTFNLFGETEYYYYVEGLIGGQGNDSVTLGNNWSGYVDGYSGNDTIVATGGSDTLLGGTGNDSIDGAGGNDSISGGSGNDTLIAGGGVDTMDGGAGNDQLRVSTTTFFRLDGGTGVDSLEMTAAMTVDFRTLSDDVVRSIEVLKLGAGNQVITLSDADVLNMTGESNLAVDVAGYQTGHVLVIDSTAGTDSVQLTSGWTDTGDNTTVDGTGSFSMYRFGTSNIYVALDDSVTPSIGG
jgi:Ca2+-binding RTX toxin-like protein